MTTPTRFHPILLSLVLTLPACHPTHPASAQVHLAPQDIIVSPAGPIKTLTQARDLLRTRRAHTPSLPTTIWVRQGRYFMDQPFDLGPQDANTTYAAYPNEHPTLDAGRPITKWKLAVVNGNHVAWVATVPADWTIRQLIVDRRLAPRPRLPKITGAGDTSIFRMERADNVPTASDGSPRMDEFKGADAFTAKPGDFIAVKNIADVEAVVLHFWIEERMPIESYDPATRRVVSTRKTQMALADDHTGLWARYYLDNVFEALTDPGEWYYDRPAHQLYYLPLPHQSPSLTHVYAAGIDQLLNLHDTHNITFRGLILTGTGWHHPSEKLEGPTDPDKKPPAGMTQTAATLPAVVTLTHATHCRIDDCALTNIGEYAIELREGCTNNQITGNEIAYCGGGGIKINGGAVGAPADTLTHDNAVTDNHIHHIGRVFHSAAAVLVQHAYAITVAHNDIHDGYQMAVAVGWSWGYGPSVCRDNHIEYNYIHHFGQGWLSDMGGVYTLGLQPGTTVRNNHIHDIRAATYGAWGIYPDEGSSDILIENNLVHDTTNQPFHQHYGQNNTVRNNIFAFGKHGTLELTRDENHNSFTLTHNLLISDNTPIFADGIDAGRHFTSDYNLLFDIARTPPHPTKSKSFADWQKTDHDEHSVTADPLFKDLSHRDFTLPPNSPAFNIGFHPLDLSQVGPRPKDQRN